MTKITSFSDVPDILHKGFHEIVQDDWIDYNGHMNVAYYLLAFDHATDHFANTVGLGEEYLKTRNSSFFALDINITYRREVRVGAELRFATQVLGVGPKKLLFYHYMFAGAEGYLAATSEHLSIHVDMNLRKSAPFPEDRAEALRQVEERHKKVAKPDNAGRVLSL